MNFKLRNWIWSVLFIVFLNSMAVAQTTGKITGRVTDAKTQEPLVGANIMVQGSGKGSATDDRGAYYILNLPPGVYTLQAFYVGYEKMTLEDVRVSVNRSTTVDIPMRTTILEGQQVTIEVDRISVKKDLTNSTKNISSDQMAVMPVENVGGVVAMQAGVVEGHFRGGRSTEVSYLIDGIQVDETFDANYAAVDLEAEAIQDLEVITGTFNAEYGRAMSGVVNAVTKDGSKDFQGAFSIGMGNYYTRHTDIFVGLKNDEFDRNQDYKVQLSGPVWGDRLTFFTNFRWQDNLNYLNGIRRFNVDDFSDFSSTDSTQWFSRATGDQSYVPMNSSKNASGMGKITWKVTDQFRLSYLTTLNNDKWRGYDHVFKYNPDGKGASYRTSKLQAVQINQMFSNALFYELKLNNLENINGYYVFRNPLDTNYVNDIFLTSNGPGFFTGGQEKTHSERTTIDRGAKLDITWQANARHELKSGFQYTAHTINNDWHTILNHYRGTSQEAFLYAPEILPDSTLYADVYTVRPVELSAYIQDKMEFQEMVINLGIRWDSFDPATVHPSVPRNPANQLDLPDSMMSGYPKAPTLEQISPRLGLAYQLGSAAVLHFSYGHFFQMPPFYALYQNHSFLVPPNDYGVTMGNARLKPEKTVSYEIGLWQELAAGLGLEVSVYYRDIYNLLSTKIISTFNQIEYGLYTNKDYGNARGLEVKMDYTHDAFSAYLNYTLQYTRGNADTPSQTFDRAGSSMDPVNRFIPMSWDQRHTLNLTAGYRKPNYGITATGYYNSGSPYTFSPQSESHLSRINLYPNNDYRPTRYSVDLNAYYNLQVTSVGRLEFTLSVYNLLDRLNEVWVNSATGRAYTGVILDTDIAGHHSNFNTYEDVIQNPSMYAAPRLVKLGVGLSF